jgi:hypothetical protein
MRQLISLGADGGTVAHRHRLCFYCCATMGKRVVVLVFSALEKNALRKV